MCVLYLPYNNKMDAQILADVAFSFGLIRVIHNAETKTDVFFNEISTVYTERQSKDCWIILIIPLTVNIVVFCGFRK